MDTTIDTTVDTTSDHISDHWTPQTPIQSGLTEKSLLLGKSLFFSVLGKSLFLGPVKTATFPENPYLILIVFDEKSLFDVFDENDE